MSKITVDESFLIDYACSSYGRGSHAQRCGTECHTQPEFKFCCLDKGYCYWYRAWWFVFTSIGVSAFLVVVMICVMCFCCCRRR